MPYKCKEKQREADRKYRKKKTADSKLSHYVVYYLPEEHYVGTTTNLTSRLSKHRCDDKRNTDEWRVLFCSEDRHEAYHVEAMYQSVLGMNGLVYNRS